jgi:predicted nucleotidyltransferase component of viral defense system
MSDLISTRLKSFGCRSLDDERQALREIIQEAALAGLWRGKFFEHAAFYGGTALRIFYGLDRFSEDLDFTLLRAQPEFQLKTYLNGIRDELQAIGFVVSVESRRDGAAIDSAFIKAGTMHHLLLIKSPFKTHRDEKLSVKIEVDTDPALGFSTEGKVLNWPFLFSVVACDLPSLFAGKIHAVLCRLRAHNVKGRDWYDLLWYLGQKTPFKALYLQSKLVQSGVLDSNRNLEAATVINLLHEKCDALDIEAAKRDVSRFVRHPQRLDGWSRENIKKAIERLTSV